MKNIFNDDEIFKIGMKCLNEICDNVSHKKITGIIRSDIENPIDFFKSNGIESGIKHFDISCKIGNKEKILNIDSFYNEVVHTMACILSEKISSINGELNSISIQQPYKDRIGSVFEGNNISIRVSYWHNIDDINILSIDVALVEKKIPKVFLGGTCNGSLWRHSLINNLNERNISYFNPVVKDWTPECMEEEIKQRKNCDFCLYAITPRMKGVYSIAEVVDDSNKRPEKTILCIVKFDQDFGNSQTASIEFDEHENKSIMQVAKMVKENGSKVFYDLHDVAKYLNNVS